MDESKTYRRVTAYLEEDETKTLKSHLVLKGMNLSEWIRRKISQEVKKIESSQK